MLVDTRVAHDGFDRLRLADALRESGGDESVNRLADLELAEPRLLDDADHVALSVEQLHHHRLLFGQGHSGGSELPAVDVEHEVETGDLLLDEAPLVDTTRALEQQRLGVDRHQQILLFGMNFRLEVERPLRPREQVVDGLLDLRADLRVQCIPRHRALRHQQLADTLVALPRLRADGRVELDLRDRPRLEQDVADAIAAIHDRRVRDQSLVEVDIAEVVAMRDGQAAGLLPHGEELKNVW